LSLASLLFGRNGRPLLEHLDFLTHEPEEAFRESSTTYLDGEQLHDFRSDAFLFHLRQHGHLPQREDHDADFQRAAAVRILRGRDALEDEFAIDVPIDPRTGETCGKYSFEFEEWAREQGKPALGPDEVEAIENMARSLAAHGAACDLLANGVAQGIVRSDYQGVACQERFDWLSPHRGIVALHVCDGLSWLDSTLRYGGTANLLAFGRALLAAATGKTVPVHVVAVEKSAPHRCGVWHASRLLLRGAERENEKTLRRLKEYRDRDHWPTGYERVRVLKPLGF